MKLRLTEVGSPPGSWRKAINRHPRTTCSWGCESLSQTCGFHTESWEAMALSGSFGAFWWEIGDLSVGAQIFTLPSSWDKLVFCIRPHLTDRIQLLNVQNHLLVKSSHPWESRNESVHLEICLGKAISSLPQGPRQGPQPSLATHSLAQAAHEALGVVGAAQRGDDLARDEVPAAVAAGAVELLVVLGADVLLVLEEEAWLG